MRFLFAGGGTGGHVIPALAVAGELRRRGHEPFFVGTKQGMEAKLVPAAGFPIEWIDIGGLNRVGLWQRVRILWQLPLSTLRVWNLIGQRRPAALFSMGGYVAGPAAIAAGLRRLPSVLMEPNAVPGMTNRRMASFATRALVNFPETVSYFPPGRAEVTGVPVREEFFQVAPKPAGQLFTLLITGGSQGSRTLNRASRESWDLFRRAGIRIRIVHQAGRLEYEQYRRWFAESGTEGELVEFIRDMPAAFADADLIVARSGASTVSEISAAGKPSILVPFPFAADNHQLRNAEAMARAGAARLILDGEMTGQRLFDEVTGLLQRPEELSSMGSRARGMAHPGAAQRAADVLESLAVR
jgi:UDP-N-acetylglucosamine--N-acetylmuramyl-(pentapeptide) pyrophosphoryl-undecaprenol N-acetylglucosamine transferase